MRESSNEHMTKKGIKDKIFERLNEQTNKLSIDKDHRIEHAVVLPKEHVKLDVLEENNIEFKKNSNKLENDISHLNKMQKELLTISETSERKESFKSYNDKQQVNDTNNINKNKIIIDEYKNQHEDIRYKEYKVLPNPKKLLLVFDLNGVLLCRKNKKYFDRSGLKQLMDYCIVNFNVAIWSSVMPKSMDLILNHNLLNYKKEFIRIYTRNDCTLSGNYYDKCEAIKDLNKIWLDLNSNSEIKFGFHNTCIIDDSDIKCKLQPKNQIKPKEYEFSGMQDDELFKLKAYLELLNNEFINQGEKFNVIDHMQSNPYFEFKY